MRFPKIRAQHQPWLLSHGKELCWVCRSSLPLPDASCSDPCESVAQPREPGSLSCGFQGLSSLQHFPIAVFSPLPPSTAPGWVLSVAAWGVLSFSWDANRIHGGAPWKSCVLVRVFGQVLGTTGCHRGLEACPHHGPEQNKCAVFWTSSLEETLLLQKTAHPLFSGWE